MERDRVRMWFLVGLPGTTFTTPLGKPASLESLAAYNALSGVSSAGLRTIVQPVAKAGAHFHEAIKSG